MPISLLLLVLKNYLVTSEKMKIDNLKHIFSQPVSVGYSLGQRVGIFSVCFCVCLSAFISTSTSSPSSVEEGSSRTCVGAVPRDFSLYDIMSGIR